MRHFLPRHSDLCVVSVSYFLAHAFFGINLMGAGGTMLIFLSSEGHLHKRVIDLVTDGALAKGEAVKKLDELKQRETTLMSEAARLTAGLANILDADQIKDAAEQVASAFNGQKIGSARLWAEATSANHDIGKMT